MSMSESEALEVLGYLLGHEKAVDSGEMEDVQNCLNSQEQEALKVVLSEFRELKKKATAKESYGIKCPHCNFYTSNGRYCCNCGKMLVAKSEGKE